MKANDETNTVVPFFWSK